MGQRKSKCQADHQQAIGKNDQNQQADSDYYYVMSNIREVEENAYKKRIIVVTEQYDIVHTCEGDCDADRNIESHYDFQHVIGTGENKIIYNCKLLRVELYDRIPHINQLTQITVHIFYTPINCKKVKIIPMKKEPFVVIRSMRNEFMYQTTNAPS